MDLNKVKIGFSPLSGELFLYRHGKDPALALDKRPAHRDVMTAVVRFMMHDAPKGAAQDLFIDGRWYTVNVAPKRLDTRRADFPPNSDPAEEEGKARPVNRNLLDALLVSLDILTTEVDEEDYPRSLATIRAAIADAESAILTEREKEEPR